MFVRNKFFSFFYSELVFEKHKFLCFKKNVLFTQIQNFPKILKFKIFQKTLVICGFKISFEGGHKICATHHPRPTTHHIVLREGHLGSQFQPGCFTTLPSPPPKTPVFCERLVQSYFVSCYKLIPE